MPKSLEVRAELIARLVMRRSDVSKACSSDGVSDGSSSVSWVADLVGTPAATRFRPIERRSSSFV